MLFRSILYEKQLEIKRAEIQLDRINTGRARAYLSPRDVAAISACAFDLIGWANLTILQPPQAGADVGNPEEDPGRRALGGGKPSCTNQAQESGRAENLGQMVLGKQSFR